MKYCMDASALIDLGERHYPDHVKVFTPIWDHLYQGINEGYVISVDYVQIELERKADEWREDFIRRASGMFLISEDIEKEYVGVINDLETSNRFAINSHRNRFMNGADPWVIAPARNIKECKVVSAETKSLAHYGMGSVCEILGVEHINLVQYFEENNIGILV